jgi:hypothetical protein
MRLDRAIEILQRKVASPFVRANKDSLEATQLGIEALSRIKNEREILLTGAAKPRPEFAAFISQLPSETNE